MPIPKEIKHVIVLMMENRSYDNMLGHLAGGNGWVDKSLGNYFSPLDSDSEFFPLTVTSGDKKADGYVTDPDPPHDFKSTCFQLYGEEEPNFDKKPNNGGFYASHYRERGNDREKAKAVDGMIFIGDIMIATVYKTKSWNDKPMQVVM